jgi:hypothetical protein
MAKMLGFGTPCGVIAQCAYVVPDLKQAIAYHQHALGAGPFFVLEHVKGQHRMYRGKNSPTEISLGMSFSGHLNVELIQLHDDAPSILREGVARHGFGFHHFGVAFEDVGAELPKFLARGYVEVSRNPVPTGGEVVFLEPPHPAHPGYIEMLPATAMMDQTFTRFWKASQDWDGNDPVRPFI